jgi:DNA-binding CsgD family transcriptional regulator
VTASVPNQSGWAGLFRDAFKRSLNPMALVDAQRVIVDANPASSRLIRRPRTQLVGHPIYEFIEHGPLISEAEWRRDLSLDEFSGEANLVTSDGETVGVQFAGYPETVTGRRLVLFVAIAAPRWGSRFRRPIPAEVEGGTLSEREREVVRLIAMGASGPEIADELGISHNTVRTHVGNAMDRLGARSRAHLVAKVLGDGIAFR